MAMAATGASKIRVWDLFVRAFHWSLVAVFALAWATPHVSESLHGWLGYTAALLIVARAIWGFVGPRYARFVQFVRAPRDVIAYLIAIAKGNEARYLGHNPAGGAMIVVLLLGVAGAVLSGWLLTTDWFWGSEAAEAAHSLVVHGVLVLVALHLAGVALASFRHRENLPRAMVSGDKRAPEASDVA